MHKAYSKIASNIIHDLVGFQRGGRFAFGNIQCGVNIHGVEKIREVKTARTLAGGINQGFFVNKICVQLHMYIYVDMSVRHFVSFYDDLSMLFQRYTVKVRHTKVRVVLKSIHMEKPIGSTWTLRYLNRQRPIRVLLAGLDMLKKYCFIHKFIVPRSVFELSQVLW